MNVQGIYERIKRFLFNLRAVVICSLIWFLFYGTYVYHFKITSSWSDFGLYEYCAKACAESGHLFPDDQFYHERYIAAPGWVNILLVWYKLFGNFENVALFMFALMYANLWIFYFIAARVSDRPSFKYWAIYIYMLIPAFGTAATTANTEVAYITLASLSFLLVFQKRWLSYALAGILIALAIWIRPLGQAWMLAALYFIFFIHRKGKYAIVYLSTAILSCATIAIATHRHFPDYLYKSTTGGVNMIGSAYDKAKGGFDSDVFNYGEYGYIPQLYDSANIRPIMKTLNDTTTYYRAPSGKYTYAQVDSIYMARSMAWVKEHPFKWLSLIPRKIRILSYSTMDYVQHNHPDKCVAAINALMSFVNKWGVQTLFLISILGLFTPFWKERRMVYLIIPIVIASAITCVVEVMPRYNFVFLHLLIIFAVYSANALYPKIRNRVHSFINSHKA